METGVIEPLTWWQVLLHYFSLVFVQYPFRSHKQWLEKMYKSQRLPYPDNYRGPPPKDWTLSSLASSGGGGGGGRSGTGALPSLPENSSSFRAPPPTRNARVRRRTQLDVDDDSDEFNMTLGINHSKRTSSISGGLPVSSTAAAVSSRPPPGHLPRSQNISIERGLKKKNRRSVEIFGDIMHALGLYPNGKGKLKLPVGISELDESELSGFQARFYNVKKTPICVL